MMTVRPLLALAAVLALAGCSDSDSFDPCALAPTGQAPLDERPFFPLDAPASLQVSAQGLQPFVSCDETRASQVPDTVSVEISDPDNRPVPAEVFLDSATATATIQFTPRTEGRHHVIVSFAPVGSIQQFGVYAARPWTGAGSAVVLPLPRCTQLDRTQRGTWVCDGVALREPQGRETRLGTGAVPPDVAIAGNVVWVVGDGRVRRFVDTGSELELTGSLLLNQAVTVKVIQSRLATESELWVMDNQHLHRFVFLESGVLIAAPPTSWPTGNRANFGIDSVLGLLVRVAPDRVLAVQVENALVPDTFACPFVTSPTGAFVATDEPCQELRGTPVGFEEGVLWMRVLDQGQTLHRWEASGGWLAEQASLTLDSTVLPVASQLRPGFTTPLLNRRDVRLPKAAVVPSPVPGTLGLELLPPAITAGFDTLSSRFYWNGAPLANSVGTVVYERSTR